MTKKVQTTIDVGMRFWRADRDMPAHVRRLSRSERLVTLENDVVEQERRAATGDALYSPSKHVQSAVALKHTSGK